MEKPKIRPAKDTDQYNSAKAFELVKKIIEKCPDIEPNILAGAFWSALVDNYIRSGCSYDDFCEELQIVSQFYKHWWDR